MGGTMDSKPTVVREADCDWETWEDRDASAEGFVHWKTLISGDKTASRGITMGVAEIPPYESLVRHRHIQPEVYFIIEGTGIILIENEERRVSSRTAIYIPGDAVHSFTNTSASPLRFLYAFPADSFQDVKYVFDDTSK
jgi:mannose-6-phosphate isomerase-like protein (cupin superfamily)